MSYWDPDYQPPEDSRTEISDLSDDDLKVAINNWLKTESVEPIQLISYEAKPASENLQYLKAPTSARTFHLKVVFSTLDHNYSSNFILKIMPSINLSHEQRPDNTSHFSKELAFYGNVAPQLRYEAINDTDLPVPECYVVRGSHDVLNLSAAMKPSECCYLPGPAELFILEDLTRSGFRKAGKQLDLNHCTLAVVRLARFHALSVVLDRYGTFSGQKLYLTRTFSFLGEETLFNREENRRCRELFKRGLHVLCKLGPQMNQEMLLPGRDISKVVRLMITQLWDILEDILRPHNAQLNALCLVNCVSKSLMFSYDDQKRPIDCKIIDFKNVKYCRPSVDLVQLIYNCAEPSLRKSHLNFLLETYHEEFLSMVGKCHVKHHPNRPLPAGLICMQEVKDSFRETRLLGAARSALVTAYGCLLPYNRRDPDNRSTMQFLVEERLSGSELPSKSALLERAKTAYMSNPSYRAAMFESTHDLLECLADHVNCERSMPHHSCPHPQPI